MKDPWKNIDDIIDDTNQILDGGQKQPSPEPQQNYSDWLYAQSCSDEPPAARPAPKPKKKKQKHFLLKFLLILLVLAIGAFAALWFFFAKQPVTQTGSLGERKPGNSVILLAGTDADGTRTDTMLLASVNEPEKTVSLISLPRDTYTSGYIPPKLNSVYGIQDGGKEGMEALMDAVQERIGYRPDGYILVNLDGFCSIVDAIGGVTFDVPMDMDYEDPYQDLSIHLKAGEQKLNGEHAMHLVRFRSGYPRADLQRVEVQRDFLKAALQQTVQVGNIIKAPRLLSIILANTTTDLDLANLTWLAKALLVTDKENPVLETLPGEPKMKNGGSYFIPYAEATAELLNQCCNPYMAAIDPGMLP